MLHHDELLRLPFPDAGAGVCRISSSAAETTSGMPSARVAAAPRPTTADASLREGMEGEKGEFGVEQRVGVRVWKETKLDL